MKPKEASSSPKMFIQCKSFAVLSSQNVTPVRRSNRISTSSSANDFEVDKERSDGERSTEKAKRASQNSVNSTTENNDAVRKNETSRKRRSKNKVDDVDDDFATPKVKSPKTKKRRSRNNVQTDGDEDVVQPKKKTPVKKLIWTNQNNKITNYFGKATQTTTNEEERSDKRECQSEPLTPPPDVIVLSSSDERDDVLEPCVTVENPPPIEPLIQHPPLIQQQQQQQKRKCPEYKIVDGTNFAVDAFRFGELAGVTKYFLSHFHSDHYVGLNKKFTKPIYMSTITGRLVKAILKVNANLIKTLDINTKYIIDEVEVTAIDANHCPGAVMFIFKLPCGRTILHTGDFRATPEMESKPEFWNNTFHSIYLDTTYLHKSYNFCSQSDALLYVVDEVKKFKQKNMGKKFVIVVGTYLVGKERLWSHIAQTFKMKVWIEAERRKAFDLIYSEENASPVITDSICDVREDAQLHILPMQCINYPFLMDYLKNFDDCNLLAFRPTGWANNAKPKYGSRVSIVGVQYSEHSSYSELERFVRFIQPEKVISTVPISSSSQNTKSVPRSWLLTATRDMPKSSQTAVTSFMKVRKSAATETSQNAVDKLSDNIITQCSASQQFVRDDAGSFDSLETDYMP